MANTRIHLNNGTDKSMCGTTAPLYRLTTERDAVTCTMCNNLMVEHPA